MDLIIVSGNQRRGFEFKRADSPVVTPSMRIAIDDLGPDSLDVVYPGSDTYRLREGIRAVGIARLWSDIRPLRRRLLRSSAPAGRPTDSGFRPHLPGDRDAC